MRTLVGYFSVFILVSLFFSCSKDSPLPDGGDNNGGGGGTTTELILPKKEMRAAWFATVWELDWPGIRGENAQKQKYRDMLDRLQELKFNAVFFQVKGLGDAFYDSPYEPWSAAISGTRGVDPGYNVLQFLIDETHARGMEFHAWVNPYRISTRAAGGPAYPALHSSIDPSWVIDYPTIRIYNPAKPEVRQRLADIIEDLITKFNVDGVHFDDYFYPSGVTHNDQADYAEYGAGYNSIGDFRRGNVDKAIEAVYNIIKEKKPSVVFSVSPAPNKESNYNNLFADVAKWTQAGWVDILVPQLYQEIGNSYNPFEGNLSVWTQFRGKAQLVIGHGFYKFGTTDNGAAFQSTQELVKQFERTKANSRVVGSAMYSARDIIANRIGITDKLAELYSHEVVMPFAGRQVAPETATPTNVKIVGNELSWSAASGNNVRYAVYHFTDVKKEGKLLDVVTATKLNVSAPGFYSVTSLNVDHLESKPSDPVEKK